MIPHTSRTAMAASMAVGFVGAALAQSAPLSSVMTSINIDAGQHAGEITDVNGSIHIGENAVVAHVHDVNGSIHVDEKATADSVGTVNGSVHVGPGAHVAQTVSTVNGSITLESGADVGSVSAVNGSMTLTSAHVAGELTNVNGTIRVFDSHVGGSVSGMNGGIEIGPNSRVDGGLHVRRNDNNGWFHWWAFLDTHTPPRIVVGPGTVISGKLQFDQEVRLYVSDQATVGPIEGATAIKFNGPRPPD
jgi:DUF4097 and DUF4098 domain-containing protein YvlB